jgi:DnaJ-class molecular chaperone
MKDYYKILRVHPSVSEDEIKEAYRRLAHKHHPDMGNGDDEKFKEIHEAYEILSNSYERGKYDAILEMQTMPRAEYQRQTARSATQKPINRKKGNGAVIVTIVIMAILLYWLFSSF